MLSCCFQFLKLNAKVYISGGHLAKVDSLSGLGPILTEAYVVIFQEEYVPMLLN